MKKTVNYVALLILAISGCSSGKPEQSDVEKALVNDWRACSSIIKVENVKRVNGRDDGSIYQVDVEYGLVVTDEFAMPGHGDINHSIGNACDAQHTNILLSLINSSSLYKNETIPKDTVFTITARLPMVKTEQGWVMGN